MIEMRQAMNRFRDLRLSNKINFTIIGAIAVLAIGVFWLVSGAITSLINEVGQQRIRQETVVIEQRISEAQQELESAGNLLANNSGFVELVAANNTERITPYLRTLLLSFSFDEFEIINTEGESFLHASEESENVDEEEEQSILNETLFGIQRLSITAEENEGVTSLEMVMVRPIRDAAGTIIGGLLMAKKVDAGFLSGVNLGRAGVVLDLIYDNKVIAESTVTESTVPAGTSRNTFDTVSVQPAFVSRALNAETVINPDTLYSSNNIPITEAYLPLKGLTDSSTNAVVVVRVANSEIAQFQQTLTRNLGLIIFGLILAIIVAIGLLVQKTISQPINHLQQVATLMSGGDYSQRAPVNSSDEIGQLSTAFNTMAGAIQERNLALSASNIILEKRIDERTKELRIATREAQEASRLKDEFLAIMSHELRTPLNAMIGFQGILLMTAKLDDKAQHMVRRAQANAHRLLTLINDILDVSRIESGRMQFVKSEVSLPDLVERLQSQMSVLADEKKLGFTVDIAPDLPPTILIDEDAITKIITNLLGNAFKFTEKGRVSLNLAKRNTNLVIAVQDTGIGIPTHMHNAIFERFRQVDGSSNRTHGGSGLGLAIVQKLALALNGTINVQSVVGEGSTFTVVLPLEVASEKVAV